MILNNKPGESVEQISLEYLEPEYHQVYYVENDLINSLFGLWFWDEIYAPIQGAFCHPFQFGPLDLFTDDFFSLRKKNLLNKLNEFQNGQNDCKFIFEQKYKEKWGIANYFINWAIIDEKVLSLALTCIPKLHLSLIFKRMLMSIKENSSGFPDLIAFAKDLKTYEMIEIKGPGDKLQKNQSRWFQFFMQHQIPCRLIHVEWK